MSDAIKSVASLIRIKKDDGTKFVVMLGAGASIASGVKRTDDIMKDMVARFPHITGADADRFDQVWQHITDADRRTLLQPHLDRSPSEGYRKLATLINEGFFDLVVTFNFDTLLQQALEAVPLSAKVIIRGETKDEAMATLVEAREPRVKLLKLHGSLYSADQFLFSIDEMNEYPKVVESLVRSITSKDLLVCGYAFNDTCVIRSLTNQGGLIVCVDPSGVPRSLRPYIKPRRSELYEIRERFDEFFIALHRELMPPPVALVPSHPRPPNPFKFLSSYEETDRDTFLGRDDDRARFLKLLESQPPLDVIVVAGPAKAGKTSFARAGVLANLDRELYDGLYLRCQRDLEQSLPRDLGSTESAPVALQQRAAAAAPRRAVIVLDQFNRLADRFRRDTRAGQVELSGFLRDTLCAGRHPNLTQVWVVTDEESLGGRLLEECLSVQLAARLMEFFAFEPSEVGRLVVDVAKQGALEFDSKILEHLTQSYEQGRNAQPPDKRFTLAHVQAVCHILAGSWPVSHDAYLKAFDSNLHALHQAINVCDIMSFVEDCAWPDAAWLRNMIKVPLKESKEMIAEYIKAHYQEELVPTPPPPRLRVVGSG